jgi:uncharacterized protein YerC
MYSKLTLERFAAKFAEGKTYQEISDEMGISKVTLYAFRKELNLPRRKHGPRAGVRRDK